MEREANVAIQRRSKSIPCNRQVDREGREFEEPLWGRDDPRF